MSENPETDAPDERPQHRTLMDALLSVQAETGDLRLIKDSEGAERGTKKDKYLALDKLTAETRPLLNRHGLVWQAFPTILDGKPALRYELTHVASREKQVETMLLMLDKPTSQQQGASLTYARRQARQAVLDVVAEDDTDGQAASKRPTGDARPMPKAEREKMQKAVADAGKDLAVVIGALGLETVEQVTVGHRKAIKDLLADD